MIGDAGQEIESAIRRSTRVQRHHPTSGGIRETGIRDFLRKLLPDRYYVGTGFAFDAHDQFSSQLDVVIAAQPPLLGVFEQDGLCVLPCETVLAAIEVKRTLTSGEVAKVVNNAASVRALRPYGNQSFVTARQGGAEADRKEHRLFYAAFALNSDLTDGNGAQQAWDQKEWDRLRRVCDEQGTPTGTIDRLVILDRGIINTAKGISQTRSSDGDAFLTQVFINLANHLERESERRPSFNPDNYISRADWNELL